jgi:RNA polymerase sigma-70 factor, ECF subfamily
MVEVFSLDTPRTIVGELVVRAQTRDRAAYDALVARHARMVRAIVLSRVPYGEVEDIVQDVFLAGWQKLDTLANEESFGPWIGTIARNRAKDWHRGRHEHDELQDIGAAPPPIAEALEVLRAVRTLPEAYQETLLMRLVEGMTGPEIAEKTGLTPDSVRVNLHRGMAQLRAKLGVEAP